MSENKELPILIAQTGPHEGQHWVLKDTLLIGRDADCDIVIPSHQVSRHHARFTLAPQGVLLEDLASKNGTYHNGKPITETILIHEDDIIQIALAQKFVLLSPDATVPIGEDISPPMLREGIPGKTKLKLEKRSRRVWIGEVEIIPPLSVLQFNLLDILCQQEGQVVPRSEIIYGIWGEEDAVAVSEQALDALIRRLRDRLLEIDPQHEYIVTIRGHGLRLDNPKV
jgi:hypothetical protein